MARIICAVGAGGKTSLLIGLAKKYLKEGKKVVLTTTTHIWDENPINNINFAVVGKGMPDGRLSYPGDEVFKKLTKEFDIVLVEADGSRQMPVKVPKDYEPVIPKEADYVHVVMGSQAVGRKLSAVCYNFDGIFDFDIGSEITENTIVSEEILKEIARSCFINPLSKMYPDAEFIYSPSPYPELNSKKTGQRRILLAMMASGFGRRFGDNKLLADYKGKPLYTHMLSSIKGAHSELKPISSVLVVTSHEEIKNNAQVTVIDNYNAKEGMSAGIKLATEYAKNNNFTDIAFFLGDMPNISQEDIISFIKCYLYSGKYSACMCAEKDLSNPGAVRLDEHSIESLMALFGEKGAMGIICENPNQRYLHYVEKEKLKDIDTKEDIRHENK